MFEPALTGSGESLLVTTRSAPVLTVVVAVALLFAGTGSTVVDVTLAVLEMVPVAAALTFTTSVNVADAPAANVAMFAVAVPVPPTAGVVSVKAGPEVSIMETNAGATGSASVGGTVWGSLGPPFFTVRSQVRFLPPLTGSGS